MFNLEQAIIEWRQQMLAAGIQTPVPLEELECHLREEIARQTESGLNEQSAFEISDQRIGRPKTLKNEFKKSERTLMKNKNATPAIILAGIAAALTGTSIILPALRQYNDQGMVHNAVVGFALGIPITLVGMSATVYGLKKRRA
jgi:hypothetical protein